MTRDIVKMSYEEMIDTLKGLVFGTFDRTTAKEREALDMAIKALKQETCEEAVSRQAILEMIEQIQDAGGFIGYNTYSEAFDRVDNMPSVTPTQNWIPVSERLPEDGRPVLVYAWNVHHVVARYDSFRTENGYKKCWVTADAWNGNTEIDNEVIAWMPLPEPYQAEK